MASVTERQWLRRLITIGVLLALLSPVLRNEDGLPLSTYPMYAGTRSNVVAIVTAVGITESGESTTLSLGTIADTKDPLIAQAFLNDAVNRGDEEEVCGEIARRADTSLTMVEIATERHDVVQHVKGEPSLLSRQLHAQCSVTP